MKNKYFKKIIILTIFFNVVLFLNTKLISQESNDASFIETGVGFEKFEQNLFLKDLDSVRYYYNAEFSPDYKYYYIIKPLIIDDSDLVRYIDESFYEYKKKDKEYCKRRIKELSEIVREVKIYNLKGELKCSVKHLAFVSCYWLKDFLLIAQYQPLAYTECEDKVRLITVNLNNFKEKTCCYKNIYYLKQPSDSCAIFKIDSSINSKETYLKVEKDTFYVINEKEAMTNLDTLIRKKFDNVEKIESSDNCNYYFCKLKNETFERVYKKINDTLTEILDLNKVFSKDCLFKMGKSLVGQNVIGSFKETDDRYYLECFRTCDKYKKNIIRDFSFRTLSLFIIEKSTLKLQPIPKIIFDIK